MYARFHFLITRLIYVNMSSEYLVIESYTLTNPI